jgi:hypothetical protein
MKLKLSNGDYMNKRDKAWGPSVTIVQYRLQFWFTVTICQTSLNCVLLASSASETLVPTLLELLKESISDERWLQRNEIKIPPPQKTWEQERQKKDGQCEEI